MTRYRAVSPSGMVIRTREPTIAAELSRGGYRVTAEVGSEKEDLDDADV